MINDLFWFILFLIVVLILWYMIKSTTITYYTYPSDLDKTFTQQVRRIIAQSAWNKRHKIREVDSENDALITIKLTNRNELDMWHTDKQYYKNGKQIRFSITTQNAFTKPKIYIDADNWLYGVTESGLTLEQYRTYVINHEFGHGLGYDHQPCDKSTIIDGRCPVLYQATKGCPSGTKCGYEVKPIDFTKNLDIRYL